MKKLLFTLLFVCSPLLVMAAPGLNNLLYWNGINFSSTSSPTVGWLTATSTTATSTFEGNLYVKKNLQVEGGGNRLFNLRRTGAFDFVKYRRAAGTWTDITAEAAISRGTVSGDVIDAIGDTFVIGHSSQFNNIYVDVATTRSATGDYVWEYSLGGDTWATLTATDGTNYILNDGTLTFDTPVDWATDSQDGSAQMYFIRLRMTGSTIATEPTVYLVINGTNDNVLEFRGSPGDTTTGFWIDANGLLNLSNVNTLTLLNTLTATLSGRVSYSNSASLTQLYGVSEIAGAATALIPSSNSPTYSMTGEAWNGSASRTNTMEIYLNPDSEYVTNGRMSFKNAVVDDIAETSELMSLDTNGRLTVLGRAQSSQDMFDRVFHYIGTTYTDDTLTVSSFGSLTADVLDVVGNYVYVGKEDKFNQMYFDFGTIMSSGTTRTWEYWNGSAWTTLTIDSDGTNNWQQDGVAEFTPPVDWSINTVNSVAGLYWVRIGTASGTFTVEPTLRVLLPNTNAITKEILSNNEFDVSTGWTATGDIAYTTGDYTFTYSTGAGTLTQASSDFNSPLEPNTWYRFRYVAGVAGAVGTVAWIGEEVATGKTYFNPSTTEVDVFFKTNSNPGNFVIYVTGTASGLRLDSVFIKKLEDGIIHATGDIRSDGIFRGNGTEGIKIDNAGNVGIGTTTPYSKLSVAGTVVADSFNATNTAATSTFAGGLTLGGINDIYSTGAIQFLNNISTTSTRTLQIGPADGVYTHTYEDSITNPMNYINIGQTAVVSNSYGMQIVNTDSAYRPVRVGIGTSPDLAYYGNVLSLAGGMSAEKFSPSARAAGSYSYSTGRFFLYSYVDDTAFTTYWDKYGTGSAVQDNMIIKGSTGYVGIGSSTPYANLSVVGLSNTSQPFFVVASTTNGTVGENHFIISHSGNVGVGTSSPVSSIDIGGKGNGTREYLQIDSEAGAPAAGDCDSLNESGRMIIDHTNNVLYVCNQHAGRGWDTITLTN